MEELLLSGHATFDLELPYRLYDAGESGGKPLLVYLHGFGDNIDRAERQFAAMKKIRAYHLFIQAPYPIFSRSGRKKVSDWGRAWYLYDGTQQTFIDAMEKSSEFLQKLLDELIPHLDIERIGVVGYSMGGYLGGYFTFSRWKYVHDLIAIACRLKVELFEDRYDRLKHQHILALHGKDDDKVLPEPQKESVDELFNAGIDATFEIFNGVGHKMDPEMFKFATSWLTKIGYELS